MSDKSRPNQGAPMRYELRNGKWGAYFHDTEKNQDMPLLDVLEVLNNGPAETCLVPSALRLGEGGNPYCEIHEAYERLRQCASAVMTHMNLGVPHPNLTCAHPAKKNAPGHSHRVPGVWDEDNGISANLPCLWCWDWEKLGKELEVVMEAWLNRVRHGR